MGSTVVVGQPVAESWMYVLRGLWESALRLDEMMHVSWDTSETIRPTWKPGQLPILEIPAAMQKNDTEECIPLLPAFEALLLETPPVQRHGWVFAPMSLQLKPRKPNNHWRPNAESVRRLGLLSKPKMPEQDGPPSMPQPTTCGGPVEIDSAMRGFPHWSSAVSCGTPHGKPRGSTTPPAMSNGMRRYSTRR